MGGAALGSLVNDTFEEQDEKEIEVEELGKEQPSIFPLV